MKEQKTDVPGVYRSSDGFLINKDNAALEAYRKKRNREKELDTLTDDVKTLKEDMQEIKELLRGLVK
jgi:seryl-tRNA(Sec) selenium transferase